MELGIGRRRRRHAGDALLAVPAARQRQRVDIDRVPIARRRASRQRRLGEQLRGDPLRLGFAQVMEALFAGRCFGNARRPGFARR